MNPGILRCLTLLFLILLGYLLRRAGILNATDRLTLSKVFMNISMPAVVISSFSVFHYEHSLLVLCLLGLLSGFSFAGGILFAFRHASANERAFAVTNGSSLSIGSFAIPFLQPYLPPFGLLMVILFDTGNSVMAASGCYVLGSRQLGSSQSLRASVRLFFSSVPLCTYLAMFVLHILGFHFPTAVYDAASFIGGANPIVAMLIIGLTLNLSVTGPVLRKIAGILSVHYLVALLFGLIVFFLLPLSSLAKSVTVVLLASPMTALAIPFTEKLGLDQDMSAMMSSVSILISIVLINLLIPMLRFA